VAPQGAGGRTRRGVVDAMLLTNTPLLSLEWVSNLPNTITTSINTPSVAEKEPASLRMSVRKDGSSKMPDLPSGCGTPSKGTTTQDVTIQWLGATQSQSSLVLCS